MSNMSQAEIDALLYGEASPDNAGVAGSAGELDISSYGNTIPASGGASARHGDAYGNSDSSENLEEELASLDKSSGFLTPEEKDILGEMGNICMGAAATTMYTLLGRRVNITTPQVHVFSSDEVLSVYKTPFVIVTVKFLTGIEGKSLLILKEKDSALITELLMGADENIDLDSVELDELHLSAMGEIMNQMIGSSATSLSNLLSCPIDITPPTALCVGLDTDVSEYLDGSQLVIKISFDMEIEGLLKSKLMQLLPIETGRKLAKALLQGTGTAQDKSDAKMPASEQDKEMQGAIETRPSNTGAADRAGREEAKPVRVKPFTFEAFDEEEKTEPIPVGNPVINLISDIPLQVAVELGKTKKSINEILNMGIGSVIVLDKMAGELVEVVVNGKHIARGEVVVIDDNYGVRITDIDRSI
jgi:flagellar motor switch protein FliN/FliY